jgi:hypothetical protein
MGQFWQSVSEGPRLRQVRGAVRARTGMHGRPLLASALRGAPGAQVTHGPRLHAVVGGLLGEPARPMDMLYLRPVCRQAPAPRGS